MIEVKDLQKKFGEKPAVNGISFKVEAGEIFGFLGPNGAGKTTTVKILTGQLLPNSGKAWIMESDVVEQKNEIKPHIGVVPEKTNLYERLTVGQNLEFFCRLYGCEDKNVNFYLEEVKLLKEKGTQVKKLSRGMKQRVLLIRALLHRPRVLFLDEPTSGLDPSAASDIHKMLLKLNTEGMTIFMTSHNMEEVDRLCHRVAFLNSGSIAAIGTPEELKLRHATRKMKALVRTGGTNQEHVVDMSGEESSMSVAGWIRDGRLISIHSCEPTLADIFMQITGRDLL